MCLTVKGHLQYSPVEAAIMFNQNLTTNVGFDSQSKSKFNLQTDQSINRTVHKLTSGSSAHCSILTPALKFRKLHSPSTTVISNLSIEPHTVSASGTVLLSVRWLT